MYTTLLPRTAVLRLLAGATLALVAAVASMPAQAHDRDHRYKHGKHSYKEKYWDGGCKVERQWKRNGDYKEKRKCQPVYAQPYAYQQPSYVMPAPAIVIQPPAIVIRP